MKKWVITCEHAGNEVPDQYHNLFAEDQEVLRTHRAIDLGSKKAFNVLKNVADYSQVHTVTRLLIELNRSLHHPGLFSEFSKCLNSKEKQKLVNDIYLPYRKKLEGRVRSFLTSSHEVIHISVHSFTPVLKGKERNADIGLLYDPSRDLEKRFCMEWKQNLKNLHPDLNVRFNYPYLGKADGLVTSFRKLFPENYMGIELEINQKYEAIMHDLAESLLKSLPYAG